MAERSIQKNPDGTPIEIKGPLGVGYVVDSTHFRYTGYTRRNGENTTTPRCQGFARYSQCGSTGRFLEPEQAVTGTGAFLGTPPADAPKFYYCGVHAPSQEAARKRAQHEARQAEDAQRQAAREARQREQSARDAYIDEASTLSEAVTAAKEAIIEAYRQQGASPLTDALDEAIAARDAFRENREQYIAAASARLEASA